LENHDEPRVAPKLAFAAHRAAALTILGLPGMRFLQHGQLSGALIRPPVQLGRTPNEPVIKEHRRALRKVVECASRFCRRYRRAKILRPHEAWPGNPTSQNFVLVQWQNPQSAIRNPQFDLVIVNLASHQGQCYAPLNAERLADFRWKMSDRLSDETHEREGKDLRSAACIWICRRTARRFFIFHQFPRQDNFLLARLNSSAKFRFTSYAPFVRK